MLKKIAIVIAVLLTSGCAPTSPNENAPLAAIEPKVSESAPVEVKTAKKTTLPPTEFVQKNYLPENATDAKVTDIDFQGDGVNEKVLYYKSKDNLGTLAGRFQYRFNEHLQIFAWVENAWKKVKEDIMPYGGLEDYKQKIQLSDLQVMALGDSGKKGLFVRKQFSENPPVRYYVVEEKDGVYQDMAIPKVTLHPEVYLTATERANNCYFFGWPKPYEDGIWEAYSILCPQIRSVYVQGDMHDQTVRELNVQQHYVNGGFEPETKTSLPQYFISYPNYRTDHNSLWAGAEKLTDKDIREIVKDKLGLELRDIYKTDYTPLPGQTIQEWFKRKDGDNLYIYTKVYSTYLNDNWILPLYFQINTKTNKLVAIKTLHDFEPINRSVMLTTTANMETELAYVDILFNFTDKNPYLTRRETIRVYNLETEGWDDGKQVVVPEGQTVLKCSWDGCAINQNALMWVSHYDLSDPSKNANKLRVTPKLFADVDNFPKQ